MMYRIRMGSCPEPIPVLLVGDAYYGTLTTVRALRVAGYAPWLALHEPMAYAARSRATAGIVSVPDPGLDGEGFVRELASAAARFSVATVLPATETHLLTLAGREANLAGIALGAPSRENVERATDKELLTELAAAAGLQAPPTARVMRSDGEMVGPFGISAVVKPLRTRIQRLDGKVPAYSVRYVVSTEQAEEALAVHPDE